MHTYNHSSQETKQDYFEFKASLAHIVSSKMSRLYK